MKKSKRTLSLLLCTVFLLSALCACAKKPLTQENAPDGAATVTTNGTSLDKSNTFIYGAEFMDDQYNPVLEALTFESMLFRGLMSTDENCKPRCEVASDYSVSDDLLEYTFKLRDDVKFHDGTELTVEDVIFTLNSVRDEKVNSSLREDFVLISKVEKVDASALRITLSEPFPALLDKLTIGIIPEHCFEGQDINTADFNLHPIGCGPYKFVSSENDSKLVLTRFDDFYGQKASIENIVCLYLPDYNVRAMQLSTGEIDMAYVEPSQVAGLDKGSDTIVHKIPTADYRCVMFNFDASDVFDDVLVRQALCYATDRQAVVDSIAHGFGDVAYSPLQLNRFNNAEVEKYSYDAKKAGELLDEAGWKDSDGDGIRDKGGKKLSFKLTAPITDEVRVNIATYLVSEWTKLGIDCKVDALDWSAIDISKCDAFVLGWGSPFDADNDTYRLFCTTGAANYGFYSNSAVDKALLEARVTADEAARAACYADFQTALAEDPAYDFICYLTALYGANKRVSGINTNKTLGHHGAGVFWNIEEWTLN